MKLKNVLKSLVALTSITTVGLTIGLFVDFIPKSYPNVRILTKEVYDQWSLENQNSSNKASINYATLPTSNYSIKTIVDNPKSINDGNFMFVLGSEAYSETNALLNGNFKTFLECQGLPLNYNQSLMSRVYDSFWGKDAVALGLEQINPTFLNYIDIVSTRELFDASNLLMDRTLRMGNYKTVDGEEDKRYWAIGENSFDQTKASVTLQVDLEKPLFKYEPSLDTFYEFRPNDGKDTEYEKIYYRNTNEVKSFLNSYSFIRSYLQANYTDTSAFNMNGSLLMVRNLNPDNYTSEITNPFDISVISSESSGDKDTVEILLNRVIKFYNPDFDSSETLPPPPPTPDPELPPTTKNKTSDGAIKKQFKFNLLESDNFSEYSKNNSLISTKKNS